MALMRDKQTDVVREVHPDYVKRWPDDYEEISEPAGSVKAATEAEPKKSGGKRKEYSHGEN